MRILLLAFGLSLIGCGAIPKPATERIAEREAIAAAKMPKDAVDAKVFAELKKAGHDFKKPARVDFYLYFPEENAARTVIHVLSAEGYSGDIKQENGEWLCHLQKTMTLNADSVDFERFKMREMTVNAGGRYDGWSAAAVR